MRASYVGCQCGRAGPPVPLSSVVRLSFTMCRVLTVCALTITALTGCDPIGYGYVNKLRRPVAVVHHVHGRDERFTLAGGERRLPRLGDWPGSREKFFDLSGREIAAIDGPEIKRLQHKDTPIVLVLSPAGITLATRQYRDEWQREARAEAPGRPSLTNR
jgi:hypothetical protein